MEPLKYIDAKNNILLERKDTIGGSGRHKQKIFCCSVCFKKYLSPDACEKHYLKCKLDFEEKDKIYDDEEIKIYKLAVPTNKKIVKAVSQLAYFSKYEQEVDVVLINPTDSFNIFNPVYILVKNDEITGYISPYKKTFQDDNEKFEAWILWDLFILKHQRRRGMANKLIDIMLEDLKIDFDKLFVSCDISEEMSFVLKSRGLTKINCFEQGKWCLNIPIENCINRL